ncbi:hypothetical protein [Stagnihabitans tardus]|uniref:Uncharacterized protein n=1 Tax=Stagnihabitans tardus TaxID=2699202 RepID=A0AAE4YCU3_9RHOB|nr:hypothetical protein [Stagnihabitans tardus]NBZ89312.1 hypothetical protein [Stagnihabitans tardus]
MGRLVVLLFMGPWWIRMVVAAGFAYLSLSAWQDNAQMQAAREALIHQQPPAVIPVAELKREPGLPLQEVAIRVVIASEHNSHLVEKRNLVTTNEDLMYVLQDETAGVDEPLVRGVVMIEPSEKEAFLSWVIAHAETFTDTGPVVELTGLIGPMRNLAHSSQVLREAGLTQAPGFFQLEPFVISRASALEKLPHDSTQLPWAGFGIAAIFALIGLNDRRKAKRIKAQKAAVEEIAAQYSAFVAASQAKPEPRPDAAVGAGPAAPLSPAEVEARLSAPSLHRSRGADPLPLSAAEVEARLSAPLKPQAAALPEARPETTQPPMTRAETQPLPERAEKARLMSHVSKGFGADMPRSLRLAMVLALGIVALSILGKTLPASDLPAMEKVLGWLCATLLPLGLIYTQRARFAALIPAPKAAPGGPIQSFPSLGERFTAWTAAQTFRAWTPFLLGLGFLVLVPLIRKIPGLEFIANATPLPGDEGFYSAAVPGAFASLCILGATAWGIHKWLKPGVADLSDRPDPWDRITRERNRR